MKFKLDENLGTRTLKLFVARGHDVATVHDQGMGGASDERLYAACVTEDRILVSLDLDFANPFRFNPTVTPGIACCGSEAPGITELEDVVSRLLDAAENQKVRGRLWVVNGRLVREYPAAGHHDWPVESASTACLARDRLPKMV